MLPDWFDAFTAAVAQASPRGLTLVEEAIDAAIDKIAKLEDDRQLDPRRFSDATFIPGSAFGAADRSSEVAVHHARAHAVMTTTFAGVRADLVNFRTACQAARAGVVEADRAAADDLALRLSAVAALANADTGNSDDAYDQSVQSSGGVTATEENPHTQEDQSGGR